jgi:hypothetical protein
MTKYTNLVLVVDLWSPQHKKIHMVIAQTIIYWHKKIQFLSLKVLLNSSICLPFHHPVHIIIIVQSS